MDTKDEGLLLIGTVTIVLLAFLVTVLAVMIIYRKRRVEHQREITIINERYAGELLKIQMEVQQQTMQDIGREIHDNVGQKLTLAVLYLQQLRSKENKTSERIRNVKEIINESLDDLRSLSRSLADPTFKHRDFAQMIVDECSRIQNLGSVNIRLVSDLKAVNANDGVKGFTLRILQEFLQNSLKHSDCTHIEVHVQQEKEGVELRVTDNGRGFIPENLPAHEGIGLDNMKRRAEIIQADFSINSAPDQGTQMRLFIPSRQLTS